MRPVRLLRFPVLASSIALIPATAEAQGTAADYARAEGFRSRIEGLVIDAPEAPTWVGRGSSQFLYRKSVKGGNAFVLADAATLEKRPAFDHDRLATALAGAVVRPTGPAITGLSLPLGRLALTDSGRAIEFNFTARPGETVTDTSRWRCTLTDYVCARAPVRADSALRSRRQVGGGFLGAPAALDARARISPDRKLEAFVQNYNVAIRPVGGGDVVSLSADGSEGDAYDPQSIVWSPDSKRVAAYRVRPGYRREVHYVRSSPEDQLQPKHSTLLYNKPGDVLDQGTPVLFDVAARTQIVVDRALFPNAYAVTGLEWRRDNRAVTFEYNQRGHQLYRVIEIDAVTGKARALIDEPKSTFFEYSAKKYRYDIADGKEVIWMSERDGWNHLYLYNGVTGKVKNQITKGSWLVRGVDWVDTTKRQIYFTASGMYQGKDPYFIHAYRINFDGTGLTALTDADATHNISYSPDHQYYVDMWSRVDQPPVMQLRRASDGKVLADLERADATALLAIRVAPAGSVHVVRQGREDRHLGRDHPSHELRLDEDLPGDREHLRRAAGVVRSEDILARSSACSRSRSSGSSSCRSTGWGHRTGPRRSTTWRGRTSAMPDSRIASCGTRPSPRSTATTTSRAWGSTGRRPAVRTRWVRCCSIPSSTRSRCQRRAVTTTAWTRSGGTSSGWASLARTTRRRRTWTMRAGSRASFYSSLARWT